MITQDTYANTVMAHRKLQQVARDTDMALPPAYINAMTGHAEAMRLAVAIFDDADHRALAAALLDKADALNDEDGGRMLRAVLLSREQARLGGEIEKETAARQRRTILKHAGAITTAMGKASSSRIDALTAARKMLPDVDLTDEQAVHTVPALHMTTWGQARQAITELGLILGAWEALAEVTRQPYHQRDRALLLAALSAEDVDRINQTAHGCAPIVAALANNGYDLELATFETYSNRAAKVAEDREAARIRAEAHRTKQMSGIFGPI